MWWLLVALAGAQDVPPDGAIVLQTSPRATVQLFPRVDPGTIELVVHENDKPLDLQLDNQQTRHVKDAWAASTGGGTWFVTLYVSDARVLPRLQRDSPTEWVILTRIGTDRATTARPRTFSVDDLIADRAPRKPGRPAAVPLGPLSGDAWTARLDPREVRLPMMPWTPRLKAVPRGTPTMQTIDQLRMALAGSSDEKERTALLQHLALAHQTLGLHREARAYFDRVAQQRTDWPKAAVRLHQADAALATSRWETARTRCGEAHSAGADAAATLACLGSVSLATGHPAPTPTANALLATDPGPGGKLIAAQLLMIDNRHDQARPLLDDADDWPAELTVWQRATLGDLALAQRDLETARRAWRDVGTRGLLGRIATQRMRLIRLLQGAPSTWGQETPALGRDGKASDESAAEAHYLAAQIAIAFDDATLSAEHLTELVDRWPTLAARSDVPQRLLRVCERRLGQLQRAGRDVDQSAFYYDCWRPELNRIVVDTTTLTRVAAGLSRLGLWEEALAVQRDVAAILTRDNREDVDVLVNLAEMYIRVGRVEEGLETIVFAERLRLSSPERARLHLVAGEALLRLSQLEAAIARWRRAVPDPTVGPQARVHIAVARAEQGRCAEALPDLRALPDDPGALGHAGLAADEARLLVARCLLEQDRFDQAMALALTVSTRDPQAVWAGEARWLTAATASRDPSQPVPEDPAAPEPPWAAALTEMRLADESADRVARLRR